MTWACSARLVAVVLENKSDNPAYQQAGTARPWNVPSKPSRIAAAVSIPNSSMLANCGRNRPIASSKRLTNSEHKPARDIFQGITLA